MNPKLRNALLTAGCFLIGYVIKQTVDYFIKPKAVETDCNLPGLYVLSKDRKKINYYIMDSNHTIESESYPVDRPWIKAYQNAKRENLIRVKILDNLMY